MTSPSTSRSVPLLGLVNDLGDPVDAGARPLLQAIHQAAAQGDVDKLLRLCYPCRDQAFAREQRASLGKTGTLDMLLRVLSTHPEPTDGLTYPGLALGGIQSRYDLADANTLGVPNPRRGQPDTVYHGLVTGVEFDDATGRWSWTGINFR